MNRSQKTPVKLLLRAGGNTSPVMCKFLSKEHGFIELISQNQTSRFKTKWSLTVQSLYLLFYVLKNISLVRSADTIFAIGYTSIPIKLLSKLKIIRYKKLYSDGFFVHSPRWFPLFRCLAKLDIDNNWYIINSKTENTLYSEQLGINQSRMLFLPLGDWDSQNIPFNTGTFNFDVNEPYYFAGGYTNRDYLSLIDAFARIPQKLVVVCSRLNVEVNSVKLPGNVKVFKDVTSEEFEEFVRRAKVCILPLKHNTGASGQLVLLRYMRNKKLIISSKMDVVREYLLDGSSGIFVNNISEELPQIINDIETNPGVSAGYGEAAYKLYCEKFTYDVISTMLSEIIKE